MKKLFLKVPWFEKKLENSCHTHFLIEVVFTLVCSFSELARIKMYTFRSVRRRLATWACRTSNVTIQMLRVSTATGCGRTRATEGADTAGTGGNARTMMTTTTGSGIVIWSVIRNEIEMVNVRGCCHLNFHSNFAYLADWNGEGEEKKKKKKWLMPNCIYSILLLKKFARIL